MGLALIETLPLRAQRHIKRRTGPTREIIPVNMAAFRQLTFIPKRNNRFWVNFFPRFGKNLDILKGFGHKQVLGWKVQDTSIRIQAQGNIVTLGGIQQGETNQLEASIPTPRKTKKYFDLHYLNSRLKNYLKVLIGFIPAFATFALTKDWWLLAYGGAFIWFAITGLRNIWQSVLGGGGLRRSPLLHWNNYVSWDRLTDSLMYTGFSVPLLDFLIKTIILDNWLNITTTTHPIILFSVMALANGIYLSSHNAIRGLPRTVILGNFFRSILSIPVAVLFNASLGMIMGVIGISGADLILQKWAAIVSKSASDLVAGFIEGLGDRIDNIRLRFRDYRYKLADLIDVYARLEVMFPEIQATEVSNYPCQPREQPKNEVRNREISQMIDGILGKDFTKALAFYLSRSPEYLNFIKNLAT